MSKSPQLKKTKFHNEFLEIHQLIQKAKQEASYQINKTLIKLYWSIGIYVNQKINAENWGKGVVEELSHFIRSLEPGIRGFSARNIWRMKQFVETYQGYEKLSTLLTEITWSNHLHILSKSKCFEEKEFYLQLAAKRRYSARDFSRLIDSGTFERTILANQKLSTALTEFPTSTQDVFKDIYIFEFTELSESHKEIDLQKALLKHLKKFLLEMGPDFSVIAEEYTIQVGMKDFYIDLLMHHRGLNALIAIELKNSDFEPSHLGQLQFYLEALDRDIKKPHENPSIGILICRTKDDEVVNYALSRSVSPAMIAEYETQLIDKKILQRKLHEFSQILESEDGAEK
ncbi:MAG: hypothetical protein A3F17_04070 [Gammaproteobacteria bacterium RIFCSPHIGHO2_12_FULL_41_15]|nr:MAG: hypothetical protein A3F17_04070 [Gammaproteobacteria bacterium RIFCSPHIGHO2_12_FULL_41_15]